MRIEVQRLGMATFPFPKHCSLALARRAVPGKMVRAVGAVVKHGRRNKEQHEHD